MFSLVHHTETVTEGDESSISVNFWPTKTETGGEGVMYASRGNYVPFLGTRIEPILMNWNG